ncbi:MAG: DnaA regulatory inactivator Hda [Gammaproteobacteria bacterium]|nr:DnaA regulatory inactivator Hda [Gammaproteobacteria bacterium]
MQQLPLEIRLADHAVFSNFLPAGNELVIHELQEAAARSAQPMLWIWGQAESGRTHLLQACIADADDRGRRSAYVPLDRALGLPAAALEGLGELEVVALDDVDAIAGDATFERAVFGLFEQLRQAGSRLVVSAGAPPGDVPFRLPDLASRLKSGGVYRVQTLDDTGRLAALQIRARFRGFDLPDDTGRYLLNRMARGPASLFRVLDTLDRAALVAQKRLTIPFVRSVLD